MFSRSKMFKKKFFVHENMRKPASKDAEPAQIQPKSQFLFHKNQSPTAGLFYYDFVLTRPAFFSFSFCTEKKKV